MSPPAGQQLLNKKFLKIASPMRVIMPKSIINLTFLDFKAFDKNIEVRFVFMLMSPICLFSDLKLASRNEYIKYCSKIE